MLSKITANDNDELVELTLLEGLTLEEAKEHILESKEHKRLEELNDSVLTKLGI